MYCLSCKKHTLDRNIKAKVTKNNKPHVLAKCAICGKINQNLFLLRK